MQLPRGGRAGEDDAPSFGAGPKRRVRVGRVARRAGGSEARPSVVGELGEAPSVQRQAALVLDRDAARDQLLHRRLARLPAEPTRRRLERAKTLGHGGFVARGSKLVREDHRERVRGRGEAHLRLRVHAGDGVPQRRGPGVFARSASPRLGLRIGLGRLGLEPGGVGGGLVRASPRGENLRDRDVVRELARERNVVVGVRPVGVRPVARPRAGRARRRSHLGPALSAVVAARQILHHLLHLAAERLLRGGAPPPAALPRVRVRGSPSSFGRRLFLPRGRGANRLAPSRLAPGRAEGEEFYGDGLEFLPALAGEQSLCPPPGARLPGRGELAARRGDGDRDLGVLLAHAIDGEPTRHREREQQIASLVPEIPPGSVFALLGDVGGRLLGLLGGALSLRRLRPLRLRPLRLRPLVGVATLLFRDHPLGGEVNAQVLALALAHIVDAPPLHPERVLEFDAPRRGGARVRRERRPLRRRARERVLVRRVLRRRRPAAARHLVVPTRRVERLRERDARHRVDAPRLAPRGQRAQVAVFGGGEPIAHLALLFLALLLERALEAVPVLRHFRARVLRGGRERHRRLSTERVRVVLSDQRKCVALPHHPR